MVALVDEDLPGVRMAQPNRMLDDRLENRLKLEVRTTNCEKYLARRRLLIKQLGEPRRELLEC